MTAFPVAFHVSTTAQDLIESLGAPHTEVDLILVNGEPAGFSRLIEDGDRVSVYPVFESIDIAPVGRLRPRPLRELRFVLDVHLGRLAAYLRMLGFDSLYRNDYADEELARISSEERRILLTRDRGLLKRGAVTRGYSVRETTPRRQLAEVIGRFDLAGLVRPFERCIRCNGALERVPKELVAGQVPPRIADLHDEFLRCGSCGQVYWKGSHYERMRRLIERVL